MVVDTIPGLDELIILNEFGSFLLFANKGTSNLIRSNSIKFFSFCSSLCCGLLNLMTSRLKHLLRFLRCFSSGRLNYQPSMLENFSGLTGRLNCNSLKILACTLENFLSFLSNFSGSLGELLAYILESLLSFLCGFSSHSDPITGGLLPVFLSFLGRNLELGSEGLHYDPGPAMHICSITGIVLADVDHIPLRIVTHDYILITHDPMLEIRPLEVWQRFVGRCNFTVQLFGTFLIISYSKVVVLLLKRAFFAGF